VNRSNRHYIIYYKYESIFIINIQIKNIVSAIIC